MISQNRSAQRVRSALIVRRSGTDALRRHEPGRLQGHGPAVARAPAPVGLRLGAGAPIRSLERSLRLPSWRATSVDGCDCLCALRTGLWYRGREGLAFPEGLLGVGAGLRHALLITPECGGNMPIAKRSGDPVLQGPRQSTTVGRLLKGRQPLVGSSLQSPFLKGRGPACWETVGFFVLGLCPRYDLARRVPASAGGG